MNNTLLYTYFYNFQTKFYETEEYEKMALSISFKHHAESKYIFNNSYQYNTPIGLIPEN